ncbi:PQQ-dependent dehydrogenase, methanol/ethanol family [Novosphingobium aerophilum]|uniref:PQQ-dependent dehydrogenase, methanol/ethanol family n=1 Tax=Novosphingobium TaxID=165696 RepID=UPI0006C83EA7|nr:MULTISPECIES: PQQ-dependent dehydrogenase, methanol/ethanol family [unclassified Novosphingobium]KPH66180.1 alcohol dehydrogenase [Novosphingobium sp. ST904]MPS69709.1 PQQ-dependent dehydrogenase, methanol/ethanol family [Novosphingobium sp.]TCM36129.1 alcohol dehydrogenase (cytochrome c)/quinohemoprotein ethanol dehydrogenase [Novosphingobium sp. ST904]WRT94967.1 PQQ-dependent dehydrogenase, methanol/ethanol family [Novosphingobium sp. RL4]
MVAKRSKVWLAVSAGACLVLAGCGSGGAEGPAAATARTGDVTGALIVKAPDSEWLSYGRTYDEQRFSPLSDINRDNVKSLGLAWFSDLDTARGQESTPLVIDGRIYITTAWSKVRAYDAATGKELWAYDPEVPGDSGVKGCCDVVNRGLGAWGDKLYLGTFDGRLIALDRDSGKPVWSKVTVDQSKPYTITGAPRVIDGKVIVGNGGAEMGVRGYITAYDAETGKQLWRFYTVPDAPGRNAEPYLKAAEKTWYGEYWKQGGGGTVWDSMAYDPELDLLYIGVGNGSPWNQGIRSQGKGDNLYLSSIVAIRPKTGEYVWHFQTTPGETWDFTATQHIMLADLQIGGKTRKVLMQAPKNGFFYVIDRKTGEFISGKNFVPVNWASGLDPRTGRPIENPEARYYRTGKPWVGSPGAGGAHSWHPMAWDPKEKLVFIPAQIAAFPYFPDRNWKHQAKGFNTGVDMAAASMPADAKIREAAAKATKGVLIAWDPVAQKERWRVTFPSANNGGLLATGGGLVFQGNMTSEMAAYATDTGAKLWSWPVQTGVVAPPITYKVGGTQYVAVVAGWGGIWALAPGGVISQSGGPVHNISRLLVFRLGGTATLPPAPKLEELPLDPPAFTGTPEQVAAGSYRYGRYCGTCHGDAAVGGGLLPDLRRSALVGDKAAFQTVVHDGALKSNGMVGWSDVMSAEEIEAIRQYVIHRANEDKALEKAGGK